MKSFFGVVCICLSLTFSARAWNTEGHMVVAQIAYTHLQPDVKAQCDYLIGVYLSNSNAATTNFITASSWADDFRNALGTGNWHYIDLPISLDGSTTTNFVPESFDVVQAINLCVANLQNPAASDVTRATYLRYLIHLLGDIQQPLHCTTGITSTTLTTGDAGGNGFSVGAGWGNLHSLWDSGGNYLKDSVTRPLDAGEKTILSNKVAGVEAAYPYDYTANLNIIPDPMLWAKSGSNIAQTITYVGITRGGTPSAGYLTTAANTTQQLMAQGGHQLADLLNTILATNAVALKSRVTNGNFAISWNGLLNRTYRVQWKQDFTDATWTDLTNITGTANQPISVQVPVDQPRRFYRVNQ